MKKLMLVMSCLVVLAFGCSKPTQPDLVVMQGTWHGSDQGGKPGAVSLMLTDSTMEFHGADPREWYKGTYTLHTDTTPKQMIIEITECPMPKYVGKTAKAIYELKDGAFTLAAYEPGSPNTPTSFDVQGARKIVFKK